MLKIKNPICAKKTKKTLPEIKKEIQKKGSTQKKNGTLRVKYEYEIIEQDENPVLRQEITDKSEEVQPELVDNEAVAADEPR